MDLAEIFRVMCRRWYVLVPGLVLTAALTVGAWLLVPVSYESQSTVALLNSRKGAEADGNPFLSMEPSLTGMADSLARNVNSDASVADLTSQGLTAKYEAKIADNAQGPLLWLTVTGEDRAAVLRGNRLLMSFTEKRLKDLQAEQKVAPESMIRMTTIVPPQDPEAKLKSKIQYLVMAAGLGIVLSLVGTFFAEARGRRRAPAREPHDEGPGIGEALDEADVRTDDVREDHAHAEDVHAEDVHAEDVHAEDVHADDAHEDDQAAGATTRPAEPPTDQPTVQLPVLPAAERRPAKRPPSWVK
ncbi:chain length determinant protein [Streptomyces sp. NPDC085481]|uniref:chain length determinant protein n=1 Tax=Streptomyces sp. NPDC085481 TaxID=3365727 RepID=UPI0037D05969